MYCVLCAALTFLNIFGLLRRSMLNEGNGSNFRLPETSLNTCAEVALSSDPVESIGMEAAPDVP